MEVWRDIPGYEGVYQVSDMGRVKSLERVIMRSNGIPRLIRERMLALSPSNKQGHLSANLSVDGVLRPRKVHSLVMLAFVGPRPAGCEIRHLNSNHTDNRLCNLSYGTKSENMIDAAKLQRCSHQKLTPRQVEEIRERLRTGEPQSYIAKEYGITQTAVSNIKMRKSYAWL